MKYILDFIPYQEDNMDVEYYAEIENKIANNQSITENDAENFLRTINYIIRKKINPELDNFENTCDLAQSILGHYLNSINCKVAHCSTQNVIAPKVAGHNFSIVTLNVEGEEKDYLVDPTYIQFFTQDTCNESNFVVSTKNPNLILLTPSPGYFISNQDNEPAEFLLRYGYIELTPEYAKMYGDSFYNTDRGLKLNPKEKKSLPGLMYLKSFKDGHEPLSTTHEKLLINNQNVVNFNSLESVSKKAI